MRNGPTHYFPDEEYQRRWACVRESMSHRGLDACLISSPENVYYLTGLDHQGYFAFQALFLPLEGRPVLVTRAMEKATVSDLAPSVEHVGYADAVEAPQMGQSGDLAPTMPTGKGNATSLGAESQACGAPAQTTDPNRSFFTQPADLTQTVDAVRKTIYDAGLGFGRIGLEKSSNYLQLGIAEGIIAGVPEAKWSDASGLVEGCCVVQSPLELECTREAAKISDGMMLSAIAVAGPGVPMPDIAAAVYATMIQRGGISPGFVPMLRSNRTLEHEHGTWDQGRLESRDLLFLEMSGCVRRYHAPIGRLVYIGDAPKGTERVHAASREAIDAVVDAMAPGVKAREVYQVWQESVNRAGFSGYQRHHCGYSVGIGFPPSWSGGGVPVGLRPGSDLELRQGMVFHLLSWLLETSHGSAFVSDAVVVTEGGCERLTSASRDLTVR